MERLDGVVVASESSAGLPGWAQFLALGVGLALLALDLVVLWLSAKERTQRQLYIAASQQAVEHAIAEADSRNEVIRKLLEVTHLYTRAEYETLIVERVEDARERILCFWFSLNLESRGDAYRRINEAFSHAAERGVVIRIITSCKPERLGPCYELRHRGVEAAFQDTLMGDDLRFMLVDRDQVVLGLPDALPGGAPSRLGVTLPGYKLTGLLLEYFENQWREAQTYDEYLGEIVARHLAQEAHSSVDMLSSDLNLPTEEIERLQG